MTNFLEKPLGKIEKSTDAWNTNLGRNFTPSWGLFLNSSENGSRTYTLKNGTQIKIGRYRKIIKKLSDIEI